MNSVTFEFQQEREGELLTLMKFLKWHLTLSHFYTTHV